MRTFMNELLDASADVINHYFRKRTFTIEQKSNQTPVTPGDRESEQLMRTLINDRFPDHGIIGEEFGSEKTDAEYVWVLDPIDGTLAFIHGVPLFVTLVALLKDGQPIWGAINQPVANVRCEGDNQTAWLNGGVVSARMPASIEESTVLATDIMQIRRMHSQQGMDDLLERAQMFRTWGDGFGYILLASGKADIMLDAKMAPWDILPVIPIVRGSGATITTFSGGDPVVGDSAISAHPKIHKDVVGVFATR